MTASARFAIDPKTAIAKFLVDMRILSERTLRPWKCALADALSECRIPLSARKSIIDAPLVEDLFFGGMVALHAYGVRGKFAFPIAEALLRELALQIDGAVGRMDNTVSSLVFIVFGNIRKAHQANNGIDHDQIVEALLERLGLCARPDIQPLMTNMFSRQALAAPLALAAPNWWDSFDTLYTVDVPALRALPRRIPASMLARLVERPRASRASATNPPLTGLSLAHPGGAHPDKSQ